MPPVVKKTYAALATSLPVHHLRPFMIRKTQGLSIPSRNANRHIGVFHVLITVAGLFSATGAAFAADDPVKIASLENRSHGGLLHRALPPRVKETVEYYEVAGNSEKDLQRELRKNGVPFRDGNVYDSATQWDLSWDYGYDRSAQACVADAFTVTVQIAIRYPKWVRNDDAPSALAAKWEVYQQNLVLHETGHRDMVLAAAADLSSAVENLPPAATCDALDREVRALARGRIQQLRQEGRDYDRTTGHGLTQGAILQ